MPIPSIQFTDQGEVLPLPADIRSAFFADEDAAFGGGLNPAPQTPQGNFADIVAAAVVNYQSEFVGVINQFNPSVAAGRSQDSIGNIYFLSRNLATGTVVTCQCVGVAGTVLAQGVRVQDVNGHLYASTAAATIPAGGTIDVQFQCLTTGAIACASGAITTIFSSVIGWDAVSNAAAGTSGRAEESRADFEARRVNSVAANSQGMPTSVLGAVLSVPNVLDCKVINNDSGAQILYGSTNYPVAAHCIVASVVGGNADAVANAIWLKKGGAGTVGNQLVIVYDTAPSYSPNFPPYQIRFLTPTAKQVAFHVSIVGAITNPSNVVQLVKDVIIAAFNGTDGLGKVRIDSKTVAGRYYAAIATIGSGVQALDVLMGIVGGSITLSSLTFGIDELPTLDPANITVTVV